MLGIVSSMLSIVYHVVYHFKFKLEVEMQKLKNFKKKILSLKIMTIK